MTAFECEPFVSRLTVIITTSPTPSAPATDLIDAILKSFRQHCPILLECKVIVVLDTFERVSPVLRLKKGHATPELAQAYQTYKTRVKDLFLTQWKGSDAALPQCQADVAEYGSPGQAHTSTTLAITTYPTITFIEPHERLGFGLGVRSAVRRVATPYVWVQQHDWALDTIVPVQAIVAAMCAHHISENAPVRYVCLPSVRMLGYAGSMLAAKHPTLRRLTEELKGFFSGTMEAGATEAATMGESVPLTPMFFWHDKTHIANTEHYKKRVFPSRLAMSRGAFIEDTIGHRARDQMKEGEFTKWATWMYYPEDGQKLCLRHLDGRMWKGTETEAVLRKEWMETKEATAQKKAQLKERQKENIAQSQEDVSAGLLWMDHEY
ncbi:hypothetical protein BROUX41_005593 [Berkeleyomyces rouxiae]|uniref:uncharacterized protein n=1 Tax=Berkeleyomyces rouxiae TaxID=2035830 RepID=UPI003B78E36D